MALHDLGYRSWSGELAPAWSRWATIASTGVRCAWQSRWLRRMVFLAWLPAFGFALGFFLWEHSLLYSDWRVDLRTFVHGLQPRNFLSDFVDSEAFTDPASARHTVWAWLLYSFFRYPQGLVMVLVVGIIAPPLISQDLRSRAYLLYFSRPLTRSEYVLGKATTVWFFLFLISTLPALVLYLLGIMLSPNLEVIRATWDLPLRILAASAVLMVPTAVFALCMSSMTQESRYAAFAWFSIWILGWFSYGVMTSFELVSHNGEWSSDMRDWSYLSLYHTIGMVQSWVFGFTDFASIRLSAAILIVISLLSTGILLRRVVAPMKV